MGLTIDADKVTRYHQNMQIFFAKHPKLKAPLIVLAAYLLIGGVVFSVVSESDKVEVSEKEQRVADDDAEIHPARTNLIVDNGYTTQQYYVRLDTSDTFMTMLDYHRENSGFDYAKVGFIQGIALDSINGLDAPEGYMWKVYDNETDISFSFTDRDVENDHTYRISLEPIE